MGFLVSNVLAIMSLTAISCILVTEVRGQQGLQEAEAANYEDSHLLPFQFGDFYNSPKRAGFVGMRGKKASFEYYPQNEDFLDMEYANQGNDFNLPRNMRAGFVGMRGKKDSISSNSYASGKRAGFVGMRGKKGDWPYILEAESQQFEPSKIRRGNSGFVGMRG